MGHSWREHDQMRCSLFSAAVTVGIIWGGLTSPVAAAPLTTPGAICRNVQATLVGRYGYPAPYTYYPPAYGYYAPGSAYPPAYGYYPPTAPSPYVYYQPYYATPWFDAYTRPYYATPWF
jgi:hypothetical protein